MRRLLSKQGRLCKNQPFFFCRFVNDVLHIRKSEQDVFRRAPIERTHREIVVLTLTNSQFLFEIVKGIEFVGSIEFFIVPAVTTGSE